MIMKLPISTLRYSQENYEKHISPPLDKKEFEKNKSLSENFFKNTVPILQKLLEEEKELSTTS